MNNDRYAECLNNCQSDIVSTQRRLAQVAGRPAPVALPRFCNTQDVLDVRN